MSERINLVPEGSDITIDDFLEENSEKGIYRLHRSAFTNEELFELEMKYIFENNWVYLAHESQVPDNNDYYTSYIGRQPVILARNKEGELHCMINSCSHRGAQLCRHKKGNKATYTCPFHGWTFNNSGKLLKVKDPRHAGYPECFNKEGSHDLKQVKMANYKGFIFASLNDDVQPIGDWLGGSTKILDMIVNQSPEGLEVLRGTSTYTFDGNWKLQAENGADGYHVSAVHWNYAATTARRKETEAVKEDNIKAMNAGKWGRQGGGFYSFENGHMLLWTQWENPQDRPNYAYRDEYVASYGEAMADWMIERSRNLCLYPNVYIMDQFGSQIRMLRPIAVDKTEVSIWCIAPKGESDESRARRIRQYEDFFNVTGMATPDDLEEFRSCQEGYNGIKLEWNDMCRGSEHWIHGADEGAAAIDLKPLMSGVKTEDEGLYTIQHRYWHEEMKKALEQEQQLHGANSD
ncbi:benzoate 1,2-dioxygenase large subunit [Psychrobacter faecalis]|uniref:Benzoate 1,2-dioxygenase large subunit n=1 Tax=Psychrobacter faecalis TaxID=180588 RepID=A0ABT9HD84_9GAMM|nr:benzoate 1,2-dioxygenase large subunit [Psychrobacter faecalis]MDP4543673.1 benzoate 1,2-dioxygenase large subunit [Psychrobacter faecalis]